MYERAIPYFELAAAIQPQEVKWALMTASCYRRIGAYPHAFKRWVGVRPSAAVHRKDTVNGMPVALLALPQWGLKTHWQHLTC